MARGDNNRHIFKYNGMSPTLAYLIGVYMGDGYCYIRDGRYGCFRVKVVDMDFLLVIQQRIYEVLGFLPAVRLGRKAEDENSRDQYCLNVCCSQFACWLVNITGKKAFVPAEILSGEKDLKLAFVQGLMDSEACISPSKVNRQGTWRRGVIEFGVKSDWIHDVWSLCEELGASPSPIRRSGGIYRFRINSHSYSNSGLTFNISRKRELLYDALTPYKRRPSVLKTVRKRPSLARGSTRLTDEEVTEIRRLLPTTSFGTLAERFHVSEATIRRIAQGKTFKDLLSDGPGNQE